MTQSFRTEVGAVALFGSTNVEVTATGLRVSSRVPYAETLRRFGVAALSGTILALTVHVSMMHVLWVVLIAVYTGYLSGSRALVAALTPAVTTMRRFLEIRRAGESDYRSAAAGTFVIDGEKYPLEALKRVSVERLLTHFVHPDGSTINVPHAARVVLMLRDRMIVIQQLSTVEGAAALATDIARAAGLEHDWLTDRVNGANALPDFTRRGLASWTYMNLDSYQFGVSTEVTLPTGLHAITALLRLLVVLTLLMAEIVLGTSDRVDDPAGRWIDVGALWLAWWVLDTSVTWICGRLLRKSACASFRARMGLSEAGA